MSSGRRIAAVAAVGALALTGVAPAAAGRTGPQEGAAKGALGDRWTVMTWNVAGGVEIHKGRTEEITAAVIRYASGKALAPDTPLDFLSLNALCFSQFESIRKELRRLGWARGKTMGYWSPSGKEGCGKDLAGKPVEFGNAIFARQGFGGKMKPLELPMPSRPYRRQHLICAYGTGSLARLWFCSTHINPFDPVATKAQIQTVQAAVEKLENAGNAVILAGDLNITPDRGGVINKWRDGTGPVHTDLDWRDARKKGTCRGYGETTRIPAVVIHENRKTPCEGRKIDYILVDSRYIDGPLEAGDAGTPAAAMKDTSLPFWADAQAPGFCPKTYDPRSSALKDMFYYSLEPEGRGDPKTPDSKQANYCSDHKLLWGFVRLKIPA